jgi:hypothetical protein
VNIVVGSPGVEAGRRRAVAESALASGTTAGTFDRFALCRRPVGAVNRTVRFVGGPKRDS